MNQYLQIFTYLKEFAKLRNKVIYDIDSSTQYQNIWLDSVKNNDIFYNALNGEDKKNHWLKLKKPKAPQKPAPIKPPQKLIDWIDEKSLYDENNLPFLKDAIILENESLYLSDFPELKNSLADYVNNKWSDELSDYQKKNAQYKLKSEKYKELLEIYQNFFKFYEELKDKSDTHELVIGVGLFHYKKDNDSQKHYRHIITQAVNIEYKLSAITIQISDEDPKIEKDFISKEFNKTSINDAIEYFESIIQSDDIDDIDLLDSESIKHTLEEVADQIGVHQYNHNINKPEVSTHKLISYSPTLILRKKSTSKFDETYSKIIETIEQDGDSSSIKLIDSLLRQNNQPDIANVSDSNTSPEVIYFSNPSNKEQIQILEKSRNNNAVLVQGPPGTGKSYTIANLMCHLLATGNKVLVTAQTKRALEVLKEKLPKGYQGLAVNYLGNDQKSKDDLTSGVGSILRKIDSGKNYDTTDDEENLAEIRENIAQYSNQYKDIIRQDTDRLSINVKYQGMLIEILEQLKTDKEQFAWYEDNYIEIDNVQLQEQLNQFIEQNKTHQLKQLSDFDTIADLEKLPNPEQVEQYNELSKHLSDLEKQERIDNDDLDGLANQLKNIDNLSKDINALYSGQILNDFLALQDKTSELDDYIQKLPKQEKLKQLDETTIDYPTDKGLTILKAHAKCLLTFLQEGGKLQNLGWIAKKLLPTEIKEKYYFVDAVTVDVSPCDTVGEFETVIQDIGVKQTLQKLQDIHPKNHNSYSKLANDYQNIIDTSKKFTALKTQADKAVEKLLQTSGLNVQYLTNNNIDELLKRVEWTKSYNEWYLLDDIINEAKDYLIDEDLWSEDINLDEPKIYNTNYSKLTELNNFKELQQQLSQKIPNTIEQILKGEPVTPDVLSQALHYKHAQEHVNKLPKEDAQTLKTYIKRGRKQEQKLITQIGVNKAWKSVVDNIDNTLKIELNLWQDAIDNISNTNSRRTQRYRKIAKQKMAICKDVIPCWIMPLQQLVDTIIPEQGMYDYIIIDEASQLGIDAMLLLYLAKKIIIVGDKQQTAPEYIGVNDNEVTNAIKEHLQGIPDKEYYNTQHSFFDLVSPYFHQKIILREHFRCMPEIIAFSNKLCYAPNNTPLYPLRTYSENRLEPLKGVFCNTGHVEGRGENMVNEPEAKAIVAKIVEIIKDGDYHGKTIGIIALRSNAQKEVIRNLLLEKIDEKEYSARKIIVGKPASLQGDERDIIFLSLVIAHNYTGNALTKDTDKRRFNVAASRAKDQVWLFHSVQLSDLTNHNDLRYKLLKHITTYNTPEFQQRQLIPIPSPKPMYGDEPTAPDPFRSWFEVEVYNDILTKDCQVTPAYKVAGYEIDLVPLCADGTKIAVECDGDYWHDERYNEDMHRQDVLERADWQFFRIRYSDYLRDKHQAMEGLWELLERHSTKLEPIKNETKQNNVLPNYTNQEVIAEPQRELQTEPSKNASNTSENKDLQTLCFFNLYQSGKYILSQSKQDDADLVLAIEPQYENGYLLQCYDNGHVNKFKVSALLKRSLNREYKNGFNTEAGMPKLILLEKDGIIGITFNELGKKVFKAHLTSKLPEKDSLLIQGYKVIYNESFSDPEYGIIPLDKEDSIKRLTFNSFNARGKPMDNTYYKQEWNALRLSDVEIEMIELMFKN